MNPYRLVATTDASAPSRPTADLTVSARLHGDLVQMIHLCFRWRDGAPVVRWEMRETRVIRHTDSRDYRDAAGFGDPMGLFAHEHQRNDDLDVLDRGVHTTFPNVTHALRVLCGMAMAWEHSPVRGTDRMLRALQQMIHKAASMEMPKPPQPPPVNLDGLVYRKQGAAPAAKGRFVVSAEHWNRLAQGEVPCPRCKERAGWRLLSTVDHVHQCIACRLAVQVMPPEPFDDQPEDDDDDDSDD